jgi:signal transduction histidine kinase
MGIALENRQLFDELKASNIELERANRVKDEFLSVMSHELRTPLNVVMGYGAMMKDGMLGDVNPKQEDALGKILGRANDQLAMISNILFATAIDAAKIPTERQVVILADLFNDLESAYFASALSPDLTLSWDCPPDLPVLETDQAKLKQILQNLIDNAIKFTAKGKISISARHNREAKTIELQVADTGLGIPRDMLAAIFEKFRQVDSSETRPYGGVGMGLYIVKSFTEMLAGKIEVESEPGKGSTFTVRIPS